MKKIIMILGSTTLMLTLTFGSADVSSMLGVSTYSATKIVDAIFAGASIWTILGLIAAGGGIAALGMAALRTMVKRLGRRAAIAW